MSPLALPCPSTAQSPPGTRGGTQEINRRNRGRAIDSQRIVCTNTAGAATTAAAATAAEATTPAESTTAEATKTATTTASGITAAPTAPGGAATTLAATTTAQAATTAEDRRDAQPAASPTPTILAPLAIEPAAFPTAATAAAPTAAAPTVAAAMAAAATAAAAEAAVEAATVPAARAAAAGKVRLSVAAAAKANAATASAGTIIGLLMSGVYDPTPSVVQPDWSVCDSLLVHLESERQRLKSNDLSVAAAAAAVFAYIVTLTMFHAFKHATTSTDTRKFVRFAAPFKRHVLNIGHPHVHEPNRRNIGTSAKRAVAGEPLAVLDGGLAISCSNNDVVTRKPEQQQQQHQQWKNIRGEKEGKNAEGRVGFSREQLHLDRQQQQQRERHRQSLYMGLQEQMLLQQERLVHLKEMVEYRLTNSNTRNAPHPFWVDLMTQYRSSDPKEAAEAAATLKELEEVTTAAVSSLAVCAAALLAEENRLGLCFPHPSAAAASAATVQSLALMSPAAAARGAAGKRQTAAIVTSSRLRMFVYARILSGPLALNPQRLL
ncbi:hypothetical protein EBH_0078490 [Eimeria brunetti]|uniref:Uncharacterized protein n=1 Tax=Eimeria brunetti TaxID=51314 RepID=U6LGH1_9EIME|nr:hypothetical protein EBH_0078490 [Eimeria brunetti]